MKKENREIYNKLGEGKSFLLTDYTENYDLYVKNQNILNGRKFNMNCNDHDGVFEKIAEEVRTRIDVPTFGLCHGVRSGKENYVLGQKLNCKVIGTEIGDKFGYPEITIKWDMHDIKDEWLESCDVIYTNSFDHTYDPIYCLKQWAKTLKPTGIIVIQFSGLEDSPGGNYIPQHIQNKKYSPGDPFNSSLDTLIQMLEYTPLKLTEAKNYWYSTGNHNVKHLILELK